MSNERTTDKNKLQQDKQKQQQDRINQSGKKDIPGLDKNKTEKEKF